MSVLLLNLVVALFLVTCLSCESTAPRIKIIAKGLHFEGPHWSTTEKALYWVDTYGQKVYKLDAETNNITSRHIHYGPVSLVVSVKDNPNLVLVTVRSEVYFLNWDAPEDDNSLRLLTAVDIGKPDNRCNDGKVDAKGRLWFGTMAEEFFDPDKATLYMMEDSNYIHPESKVRPVSISNGISWTADNKFMFYIDTLTRNIDVFDFNLTNGFISNRRTLFSFQSNNLTGYPDGMTIDSDGNLWIACYEGWKVIKIDARNGNLLQEHKLPVAKVTSVMWGGPDFATLFVTTSRKDLSEAELNAQPEAGLYIPLKAQDLKVYQKTSLSFLVLRNTNLRAGSLIAYYKSCLCNNQAIIFVLQFTTSFFLFI